MRIKNIISLLMIGCTCLSVLPSNAQKKKRTRTQSNTYNWFSFYWESDEMSGRHFDKTYVMVPVKVNDLTANFNVQFDLGSDASIIYGNTINSYYTASEIKSKLIDSTKHASHDNTAYYNTHGLNFGFENFSVNNVKYLENYGDAVPKDSLFTTTSKHVGTLGADAFANKILIIDFPNKKMCVLDSLDAYWAQRTTFVNAQSKRGRLHIPFTIENKTYWFLFDTGASLFPINTNKQLWDIITDQSPQAATDTITGNSWGQKVNFYGRPIKEKVYLGSKLLKPAIAYYNENPRLLAFNKTENIDGLTGNAYFFNDIVVLDFKTSRFGIAD